MRIYLTQFKTIRSMDGILLTIDFNKIVSVRQVTKEYAVKEYDTISQNKDIVSYSEIMRENGFFTIGNGAYIIDIDMKERVRKKFYWLFDYIIPHIREYTINTLLE